MKWYRQLQFVAAAPMPQDLCEEFGTTVAGMWADPLSRPPAYVADAHSKGQRVLFSVPLIALTPGVYESEEHGRLMDEVCRDVDGNAAEVGWYYWEAKPVYSVCFYSEPFRRYLLERCREGIEAGMDVVNLDEINTHIGLMNREPKGSGFCSRCLNRFRRHTMQDPAGSSDLAGLDDEAFRRRLRDDDGVYSRYKAFHEEEVFAVVSGFIELLRTHAREHNPGFAITANLAYLGNNVPTHGRLWGPVWGPALDLVMMENTYSPEPGGPHLVLPRGKFLAWYRLASALTDGIPAWICPSIMVPRQLAGEDRLVYYELMFLEAYANRGRWGYYWWPGVDVETRRRATIPERIKDHTRFMVANRRYYEETKTENDLAILYLDSAVSARPESHFEYLALAQALAEAGYQYDVLYAGRGGRSDGALDPEALARYRAVLLPEAGSLTGEEIDALERYGRGGGDLVVFSETPLEPDLVRREDAVPLVEFWTGYRDDDRALILASVAPYDGSRIVTSDRYVMATRYLGDECQVVHLVDYGYDAASDSVAPVNRLRVSLPWPSGRPARCRLLDLRGGRDLDCAAGEGGLVIEIPYLDRYGLLVVS